MWLYHIFQHCLDQSKRILKRMQSTHNLRQSNSNIVNSRSVYTTRQEFGPTYGLMVQIACAKIDVFITVQRRQIELPFEAMMFVLMSSSAYTKKTFVLGRPKNMLITLNSKKSLTLVPNFLTLRLNCITIFNKNVRKD